ncbi:replication/maintenance protein RepL [Streptomyces sp. NPDC051907]|uniref:replication/maintenance protein RepL n=1 Tax=Streptomyces sp. NPDC051907 TaxID=3155284 RepID=UPI00342A1198
MATLTDDLDDWLQTAPVHVVVSVAFLHYLPQYTLTPVAKDAFWVVVGQLATTDARGRYIHMQGPGEIPINQQEIAKGCRVSRQTASGGMQQLMERAFLWKAGRGRYQIHPHLLYFGSAERQAEAIGYAKANRKDGELPPIPRPGAEVVLLTDKGVRKFIA